MVRLEQIEGGLQGDGVRSAALQDLAGFFRSSFGHPGRTLVTAGFVPGRIELLGKHTDYAGGHSLVCASQRGFAFIGDVCRPPPI